jgi:hypothetical protein
MSESIFGMEPMTIAVEITAIRIQSFLTKSLSSNIEQFLKLRKGKHKLISLLLGNFVWNFFQAKPLSQFNTTGFILWNSYGVVYLLPPIVPLS